jgi:hypothetical protein
VALRSVVLAPPPGAGGPRRTVVLRPGGPKEKGRLADILAALFGALLLLVAVVLVAVLPDKEFAARQFRVTFPDTLDDFTYATQKFGFNETEAEHIHEFTYELPNNVASINIRAEFTDKEGYSLPDHFRIELFDPFGNPQGTRYEAINLPPTPNGTDPTEFDIHPYSQTFNIATVEHPTEQIVAGLTHTENREQVLARLVPGLIGKTAGTWTVRVTLVQAGDCPPADNPGGSSVFQQVRCRRPSSDSSEPGSDPGNLFSLAGFIYTYYTPCIEELGKVSAAPHCTPP